MAETDQAFAELARCYAEDSAAARRQADSATARAETLRAIASSCVELAMLERGAHAEARKRESALTTRQAQISEQEARTRESEARASDEKARMVLSRAKVSSEEAKHPE